MAPKKKGHGGSRGPKQNSRATSYQKTKAGSRRGQTNGGAGGRSRKSGHVPISDRPVDELQPAPENDDLYGVVDPANPEVIELSKSIREHGVKEPLVVTLDGFIVSGHRRYAAAKLAELTVVPCRVENIRRADDVDRFLVLLREYNRQREKSLDVKLREEVINADPKESHRALSEYRESLSHVDVEAFDIEGRTRRSKISKAKQPFLDAVLTVINGRRRFWPLSDRAIHYGLLNDPPLKHASKPKSRYDNTKRSYKSLVDLLTRGRLESIIPWEAIDDRTRPITTWKVHQTPRAFMRAEIDRFLKGYYRNLLQSQPHHIEIVCEKNTIEPIVRPVAAEFTIPLTSGRGYCSLPPRRAMAQRYQMSGKQKLILLLVSDFDPDGEQIAQSFARSMRDDFRIKKIHPIKVALTAEQVEEYELPPVLSAKPTSTNYDRFVDKHGETVFELEALEPDTLQEIVRDAIDSVIDTDLYNEEVDQEAEDAAFLDGARNTVQALRTMRWEDEE